MMSSRPGTAKAAYNKIDEEVKNIKDRVQKAEEAKNWLNTDYVNEMNKKASMSLRDFYKAQSDDDLNESGSEDSASELSPTRKGKHGMYMNQLKKVMGPRGATTASVTTKGLDTQSQMSEQ